MTFRRPFQQVMRISKFVLMTTLAMSPITSNTLRAEVVFFDDFNGPSLNPMFGPSFIDGAPLGDGSGSCDYLGAAMYSFETRDSSTVLRLSNTLSDWQRVGFLTSDVFELHDFRFEIRFNTLKQSPSTSIDSFIEAWLIDPSDFSRYSFAGPHGQSWGTNRQFRAGGSIDGRYSVDAYPYRDYTWYRLVIEQRPGETLRAVMLADDDVTELATRSFRYTSAAFPLGFQLGIAQATGAPEGAYPMDVAIDYVQLSRLSPTTLGDLNSNGRLDADDIDLLSHAIREQQQDSEYDLNSDGRVDWQDHRFWVENLKRTYDGDANLDGVFNSSDLVAVFGAGQYEDGRDGNSTWVTGDWNGDGDFTSSDLVLAFQEGGYEQGARASVVSVPEPASLALLVCGLMATTMRGRPSVCVHRGSKHLAVAARGQHHLSRR
jgi:hypothetical protein